MNVRNTYANGASVQLRATFRARNANGSTGAFTDPTTVTLFTSDPDGTEVDESGNVTNPSTGIYVCSVTADVNGIWRYRYNGDGSVLEGQFEVVASVFSP